MGEAEKRTNELIAVLTHVEVWKGKLLEELEEINMGNVSYKCPECDFTFDGTIDKIYVVLKHQRKHFDGK
jgi:rubrerythrin